MVEIVEHLQQYVPHGGEGGNVPGDLALEFMNMRAKDALHALRGNITSASIQRVGRNKSSELNSFTNVSMSFFNVGFQFDGLPKNWSKPFV
jgi:hypothetical protein